jgi:predicted solute-binding protein
MTDGAAPTLAALALLTSDQLRRIAEREPAAESVLLLRALREKRQASGLSEAEEALVHELVQSYDRAVLIRSRALLVLHQRGEDIAALLGQA